MLLACLTRAARLSPVWHRVQRNTPGDPHRRGGAPAAADSLFIFTTSHRAWHRLDGGSRRLLSQFQHSPAPEERHPLHCRVVQDCRGDKQLVIDVRGESTFRFLCFETIVDACTSALLRAKGLRQGCGERAASQLPGPRARDDPRKGIAVCRNTRRTCPAALRAGRTPRDFHLEVERAERAGGQQGQGARTAAACGLLARWVQSVRETAEATCLPAGYPHTVGPNYLQYALWQGATNLSITANSGKHNRATRVV